MELFPGVSSMFSQFSLVWEKSHTLSQLAPDLTRGTFHWDSVGAFSPELLAAAAAGRKRPKLLVRHSAASTSVTPPAPTHNSLLHEIRMKMPRKHANPGTPHEGAAKKRKNDEANGIPTSLPWSANKNAKIWELHQTVEARKLQGSVWEEGSKGGTLVAKPAEGDWIPHAPVLLTLVATLLPMEIHLYTPPGEKLLCDNMIAHVVGHGHVYVASSSRILMDAVSLTPYREILLVMTTRRALYDGNSVHWSCTPTPNVNTAIYIYGALKEVNGEGNFSVVVDKVAMNAGLATLAQWLSSRGRISAVIPEGRLRQHPRKFTAPLAEMEDDHAPDHARSSKGRCSSSPTLRDHSHSGLSSPEGCSQVDPCNLTTRSALTTAPFPRKRSISSLLSILQRGYPLNVPGLEVALDLCSFIMSP
ncbi:hypothetical protein JB92DRAFT_2833564 [Gautieria morchelliformis]|nr:hypothetical protein JB92DRAFT_2833564 [Gautieria morchelliformis]